ncbi:MAG: O-methyltransferase [Chlorobi bacterium]|nr:O-methyltransferase [Chlorobiota bacterium]
MLDKSKNIEEYILQHTEPENEILAEINRQTNLKMIHPRMLSGHLQGRILSMISKMVNPAYILEIGTFTGYSALCLAEGLQNNGKLITIEKDDEIAEFALTYFKKARLNQQIELKVGSAVDIIANLNYYFDLAFIDANKDQYSLYFDLVFDKMKSGGIIVADNVLWSGKVVDRLVEKDIDTKALIDFNNKIQSDKRVENVLLPVRDGLMVIRKK